MNKIFISTSFAAVILLSGCATIMGDKTHVVPIVSEPAGAKIEIIDEKATTIFTGTTPTSVTLEKSDGSYWGKKSYTVKISKDGYETQTIPITESANGWYIGGNIIFGGLIGWFIVDPMNGAMYNLSPGKISTSLGAKTSSSANPKSGDLSFMLLQDVPLELRGKMVRIN